MHCFRFLSCFYRKFCIDGTLHDLGCAFSLASGLTKREHEKPFDFVHCSDYKMTSLFVKKLHGRPVLTRCSWARDLFSAVDGEKLTLDNRLINFLERLSVRRADLAYAPSRFVADYMWKKHKIKLSVLRPPFFLEQQPSAQIPYGLPARYMIHFGLLGKRKGTDLIAKALPIVWQKEPDFSMVWAGRELNRSIVEESRQLWGDRADHVKWLGEVERPVLYAILKKAEASVLPSRCDNLPNTVIESLLFGVPVIGTAGASIDELVEQGVTGELVPFEDSGALARAMIRGWREKRMFKGRQYVLREMNPQVAAYNLLKLADSVVMKSGKFHSVRISFLTRIITYLFKQETHDSKVEKRLKTLMENRYVILFLLFPTFFRLSKRITLFFTKKAQNLVEQKVESNTASVYEGYLDRAGCNIISGWVWDMNRPNTPVYVEIYDNGNLLVILKADEFRQDLAEAGKGNGKHAFNSPTPPWLKDGKQHSISVKVSGAEFALFHSPKEIYCEAEKSEGTDSHLPGMVLKAAQRTIQQFKKRFTPKALILAYHRVAEIKPDPWGLCVTPDHFAEHLEILQKHYRPMQLGQFAKGLDNGKFPRRTVMLTFDDGYADNLYNAKPLLESYNIPATFFLTTGYINSEREFWWDELERILLQPGTLPETLHLDINGNTYQLDLGKDAYYSRDDFQRHRFWTVGAGGDPSSRHVHYRSLHQVLQPLSEDIKQKVLQELFAWSGVERMSRPTHRCLTAEEVTLLAENKLIDVGSHTVTHSVLTSCSDISQMDEINQSKAFLEKVLNFPVAGISYPHGLYTAEIISIVRDAGYEYACGCSTSSSLIERSADRYQLPRVVVDNWDGDEFSRKLFMWLHGH
jgi:glycosyltransferase involved in cell wall biosynthesis/peptidoglycan/xylan/chitin deacetylase (PgdA/CDA1 family)